MNCLPWIFYFYMYSYAFLLIIHVFFMKVYPKRKTAYTYEEMDVVREQWAQYFTSKYLLSD